MSITSVDDIASGLASQQHINILKTIGAPKAAGAFQSAWLSAGYPGAGTNSGSYGGAGPYTCGSPTQGAMRLNNSASSLYLAEATFMSSQPGTLIIADRLWSCGGLGFVNATYPILNSGSLPARITSDPNGIIGTELWVENFAVAGAASGTLTATYVNESNSASHVGVIGAVVSAPVAGQMQPVPLQVGDRGISMLQNVITSNTWTSGSFGMTILKRITELEITTANVGKTMDWASLGIPIIPEDACVMFIWAATNTTAPTVIGSVSIIDK